jgi:HAD superfamily hydrolase (TIGR01509 family)
MLTSILFDLDGVLADSEPSWNEIDAAFLQPYGISYRGEHKDQVLGKSYPLAVEFYKQQFSLRTEMEQLLLERETIARDFYATRIPIFATAPAVLGALKEMGLKLGLATSSVSDLVLPFLRRHDIERFFNAITTGEEVQRGKPNPDIYLRAAEKIGDSPENCLVVEDALAGIAAGKAAGMRVVAIPDERFMDLSLYPGGADFQLNALEEVPGLVKQLRDE